MIFAVFDVLLAVNLCINYSFVCVMKIFIHDTMVGYISSICPEAPRGPICTKFGIGVVSPTLSRVPNFMSIGLGVSIL